MTVEMCCFPADIHHSLSVRLDLRQTKVSALSPRPIRFTGHHFHPIIHSPWLLLLYCCSLQLTLFLSFLPSFRTFNANSLEVRRFSCVYFALLMHKSILMAPHEWACRVYVMKAWSLILKRPPQAVHVWQDHSGQVLIRDERRYRCQVDKD